MGNHYTAERFINAIPGTGGIIKVLADRVGCDWHTARKYTREYATVAQAWEAERNSITDKARHNIVKAIAKGDLQMSKWWLQTMDEEFVPRLKQEVTGANGGPLKVVYVNDWRDPLTDTAPGPAGDTEERG